MGYQNRCRKMPHGWRTLAKLLALMLSVVCVLCACSKNYEQTIKIGTTKSPGTALVNDVIAPELRKRGIDVKLKIFANAQGCTQALLAGELDAAFVQTVQEVESVDAKGQQVVEVQRVYFSPLGLYGPTNYKLTYLKEGDTVYVSNQEEGLGRALQLLQRAGLLRLRNNASLEDGMNAVVENPRNIVVQEIDPNELSGKLKDGYVVALNAQQAQSMGKDSVKDAYVREKQDADAADTQAVVVSVLEDTLSGTGMTALSEVLVSDVMGEYIEQKYSKDYFPAFEWEKVNAG